MRSSDSSSRGKDIASGIIRAAEDGFPAAVGVETRKVCDVIALATHGRSGPERWVLGSIAEDILDGTRLPLLVVPSAWQARHTEQETSAIPVSLI